MKLRKVTKWYHATDLDSANAILADGYIKPNKDHMIFLATSKEDAGFFLNARGHSKYAIFEIHRRDIEQKRLLQNPATPNMLSGVYVKPIAVTNKQLNLVQDDRDLTHGIEGLKIVTEGNGKTGYSIDPADFENHLINKVGADTYKQFTNLMAIGKEVEAEQLLENNWNKG
tara:strand:+ start:837 stop:1349 length:513 start_codon:yes stop_codon:yes gene_type:complete